MSAPEKPLHIGIPVRVSDVKAVFTEMSGSVT
jgi:hypothetical protein